MSTLLAKLPETLRRRRVLAGMVALLLLGAGAIWTSPQLSAWYHLRAARSALEHFQNTEAQAHLDKCLKVWDQHAEVQLLASRCARRAEAFEQAQTHLDACQRLEGSLSPESILEGILLRAAMGDLDGQIDQYLLERAAREPERAPLLREALASGYLRMYRIYDALTCLEQWLHLQPDNVQALLLRGTAHRQVNSLPKALPDYRRVLELDPQRDDARWWFVVCLVETGRYDEAIPHLDYLRLRRPDDLEIVVRLARCKSRLGRGKQARELLDGLLAEHPDYGLALRTRGEVAQLEGNLADAEKWLRQAVRLAPQDYAANWAFFQTLQQQGKTTEAKAQLLVTEELKKRLERLGEITSHGMSARPHDPALHFELGKLLLGLGHQELGERWLLSALHQDANYQPAHAALVEFYQAQGNLEQAALHRQFRR